MNRQEQAIKEGRALSLYIDSEQADQKVTKEVLDALWQSIYDVYQLGYYGILEDVTKEELEESKEWLARYQKDTKAYQEVLLL